MICRECKKEINNDNLIIVKNNPNWDFKDTFICSDCVNKLNLIECDACHDFFPKDKTTIFHEKHICDTCSNFISYCDNCKKIAYKYDTIYNSTIDGIICRDCFKKLNCYFCPVCHSVRNSNDSCCNKQNYNENDIKPYNFKPEPIFFKLKEIDDLYLGVELEIGGAPQKENVINIINKNNSKLFYFKSDNSIPKYGVEIVTHPATLKFHESKKSSWKKLLHNAIREKLRGYEYHDCGIHIHVNKNYFNKNDFVKLDLFVNNYERLFRKLARRHTVYAEFIRNKPKVLIGKFDGTRFSAINFSNENTIEFRLFRSTMKYSALMATIELTHAVCNFIKINEIDSFLNETNETILNFIVYIINSNYKYLMNFLIDNKIISTNGDEVILSDNLLTNNKK